MESQYLIEHEGKKYRMLMDGETIQKMDIIRFQDGGIFQMGKNHFGALVCSKFSSNGYNEGYYFRPVTE